MRPWVSGKGDHTIINVARDGSTAKVLKIDRIHEAVASTRCRKAQWAKLLGSIVLLSAKGGTMHKTEQSNLKVWLQHCTIDWAKCSLQRVVSPFVPVCAYDCPAGTTVFRTGTGLAGGFDHADVTG